MTKAAAVDLVRAHYPDIGSFRVLEVIEYDTSVDIHISTDRRYWINLPLLDRVGASSES
jgi:hypothetical protein